MRAIVTGEITTGQRADPRMNKNVVNIRKNSVGVANDNKGYAQVVTFRPPSNNRELTTEVEKQSPSLFTIGLYQFQPASTQLTFRRRSSGASRPAISG